MKPQPLSSEESSLVSDSSDMVLLEIIKGMSLQELKSFDIYKPNNLTHYNNIQCKWLYVEKHLIGHRNGTFKEVSEEELIDDLYKCNNGERFRVFYVLKYPNMVTRVNHS